MTRVVDLFAGVGGFSLGFERAGFQIVAHVEKDANCRKLLDARWPDAVSLDDVATAGRHNLPDCDVVVGGSPCQGFSVAGKRKGRTDERSNLTTEFVRICDELDPGIVVWENVPGVLSMPDNAFGHFLAAMVGEDEPFVRADGKSWSVAGVVVGPRRVCGWRILDAQWFGVAQRRRRVFLVGVAYGRNGGEPSIDSGIERLQQILFIEHGVQRNSPPSRETGQSVVGCLESRAGSGGYPGTDGACAGHVVPVVAATLRCASDSPACHGKTNGTDRMTLVSMVVKTYSTPRVGCINEDEVASCMSANSGGGGETQNPAFVAIAVPTEQVYKVRRLTPTECLRLQNFPDNWFDGLDFSDSVKYRCIGNAVCVSVSEWIARRLMKLTKTTSVHEC